MILFGEIRDIDHNIRELSKEMVHNKALTSTEIKLDILQCTSCAVQTTYINNEKREKVRMRVDVK